MVDVALISVGRTPRVGLLGRGGRVSICLPFLDTADPFPKVAPPGSPLWREQAPSRKDSASRPRFSHRRLPSVPSTAHRSLFVVFRSLERPVECMPPPPSPSGCMPGTVLTQRVQPSKAQSTPGAHSSEAGKQSAIEDILWSVPGQTYVPRATDAHKDTKPTPVCQRAWCKLGWWPQESSVLSPCANSPFWTAPPPFMWTRLNGFLLHPQDPG